MFTLSSSVCLFGWKLWQGRWQGNEIVVKVLKVRDWTTRKSRDFNEEYPKLRFLSDPNFCDYFVSFVRLHGVEPTFMYYVCCVSFELRVSRSFCLFVSLFVLPLLPSLPGYFPTQMCCLCWEHVSLLLPLIPSSSHTGCLMAPSTTFCMKALVSTLTPGQCAALLAVEIKVYLNGLTLFARPSVRLCRGPDAGSEVCFGHCLRNGFFTHA